MTHDRAHALLLDLAYGELSPDEAREVSRHAAECSGCAAELERIGAVRARTALLGDGPEQPRDGGRDALVEAARRAVAGRPTRRWFTRPATLSLGAAAAVVVIAAGVTLKLTDGDLRPTEEETGAVASGPPAALEQREVAPPPTAGRAQPAAPSPDAPPVPAPTRRPARTARKDAVPAIAAAPSPSAAPSASAAPAAARRAEAVEGSAVEGSAVEGSAVEGSAVEGSAVDPPRASQRVREDVERRHAAGELTEVRRRLRCEGERVERVALVAGGAHVVKLSERRGDGAVREGWYDAAGQLREISPAGEPGDAPPLPAVAPALEALGSACW